MKFISWNVNGFRACLEKGFPDFFQRMDADIFCLQETKARPEQVEWTAPGYHAYWNSAEKPGYSGTLVFTKNKPMNVRPDLGIAKHDKEGRVLALEFADFYLVDVYTPNSQRELTRLDYRTKEWDVDFLAYLKELERHKPVIFCGDLNVAHKEIDIARPKANMRNSGFTIEERTAFGNIIQAGFIDTFREFQQDGGHYTWWSYIGNARAKNIGWRIDYFCISAALRPHLKSAVIYPEITGSDHCPVGMELH